MAETPTVTPLADWQADMARRGKLECRFVCPKCGNAASPADFQRAGADPQRAVQECIGRVDRDLGGCDWAAFGLFDICTVHLEVDGKPVPVFAFAEEPA
jgi:hypothetical protein